MEQNPTYYTDDDDNLDDMVRRLRRIETQIFNLCLHLGIDPKTGYQLREDTKYERNSY